MGSYRPAESLRTVQCMELMTGRTENIAVVSEQKKHSVKEFHDILRGVCGGGGLGNCQGELVNLT